MTNKIKSKNQGASLIELIIYVGLLGVILTVVYQLFVLVTVGKVSQLANDGIYQSAQRIVADITNETKIAAVITAPTKGNPTNQLSLNTGAVIYKIDDGRLQKQTGAQNYYLSETGITISDLNFSLVGPSASQSTLLVNFDLSGITLDGSNLTQDFQTAITLR